MHCGRPARPWSRVSGRSLLLAVCLLLSALGCSSTAIVRPPGGSPEPLYVNADAWVIDTSAHVVLLPEEDFWALLENRKRWIDYARAFEALTPETE